MQLSYTGILFRRIVLASGYTYGKRQRVSYIHITVKYASDYHDDQATEYIYQRDDNGHWSLHARLENYDKEYKFWAAIRWLEANGYITISWSERVRTSRLLTGLDNFITLTDKGLAAAPLFIYHS